MFLLKRYQDVFILNTTVRSLQAPPYQRIKNYKEKNQKLVNI